MNIPCVCESGYHTFSAAEMVAIIGAFQRGELSRLRIVKGTVESVIPLCLASADFEAGERFTGRCDVELPDGTHCGAMRGHRDGRHGKTAEKGRSHGSKAA